MPDCVIIGGGPAGLATALYLARFRLRCTLVDSAQGRALSIPRCRNFPVFPDGISGRELLARMRAHLAHYDIQQKLDEAIALERTADTLLVKTSSGEPFAGRTVLLATGMRDVKPPFDTQDDHDAALAAGLLHYCPVCDGYEVCNKRIVVLGSGTHGMKEAVFLRSYSGEVELVCPSGMHNMTKEDRAKSLRAGIKVTDGPVTQLRMEDGALRYAIGDLQFEAEAIYAAMGCEQRSGLAAALGAELSKDGCVVVDRHQRTTIQNVYAAGDVVAGLDQIATALGQAAIAATTIRNDLLG
jgi:thioredoxin reductase (NADPH)